MDSIRAAEKEPRAYILDLPTELLQNIASNCSAETLVTFRLTCKSIESATLDMWAKEYISRLECFMLDPARLNRVKNILSSRLAPHVRSLVFGLTAADCCTLSPLRLAPHSHLAPANGQSHQEANNSFLDNYETEQYDLHACEIEGLSSARESLILEIMQIAARFKSCSLGFDTQSDQMVYTRISRCRPQLTRHLIETALRERCVLETLWFSDQFPLKAAHFAKGGSWASITHGLRRLSYLLSPSVEGDLWTVWTQQHWNILSAILQDAESLCELELASGKITGDVDYGEALPDLMARTFAKATTPSLHMLRLHGINVRANTLNAILDGCKDTLETVGLVCLGIRGEGDVWGGTIKRLHAMPKLMTILLKNCFQGATEVTTLTEEGWLRAEWNIHGRDGAQMCKEMVECEPVEARAFLDMATKHKITYCSL